jgi:hypothetical protein|tara:strand:+ start:1709 stop:2119 length:411 start_codon:yes stop_codon:yes gene_type:complete
MAGKSSYRSVGNRRIPQPGGIGGPAAQLFQIYVDEPASGGGIIIVKAGIWSMTNEEIIPVDVWLPGLVVDMTGIVLNDGGPPAIPISGAFTAEDELSIGIFTSVPDMQLSIPNRLPALNGAWQWQCAGLFQRNINI